MQDKSYKYYNTCCIGYIVARFQICKKTNSIFYSSKWAGRLFCHVYLLQNKNSYKKHTAHIMKQDKYKKDKFKTMNKHFTSACYFVDAFIHCYLQKCILETLVIYHYTYSLHFLWSRTYF